MEGKQKNKSTALLNERIWGVSVFPWRLSIFPLLILLFWSLAIPAERPEFYFLLEPEQLSPGDSLQLKIGLSTGDSIKSVQLLLDYDEELFEFIKGTAGEKFQGPRFIDIHLDTLEDNSYLYLAGIVLGSGNFLNAPGILFYLDFVAREKGSSTFTFDSVTVYLASLDTITAGFQPLTVEVTRDTFPPASVRNFKVREGFKELFFTWENPPDPDFQGTLIIRSETGFLEELPDNPIIVYDGDGTSFKDSLLQNRKRYYYTAFAYDEVPNYSLPSFISAEPKEELVYAYPNPFNPDEQQVRFKTLLSKSDVLSITIYSALGEKVIDLVQNQPVNGGEASIFYWDGRNSKGELVANGVYYFSVTGNNFKRHFYKVAVLR